MEQPIAYKDEHGIWIYSKLPSGMRIATFEDFIDENNQIILGKKFLAQSFHFPRFEAHETKSNFLIKWEIWLKSAHIFIR